MIGVVCLVSFFMNAPMLFIPIAEMCITFCVHALDIYNHAVRNLQEAPMTRPLPCLCTAFFSTQPHPECSFAATLSYWHRGVPITRRLLPRLPSSTCTIRVSAMLICRWRIASWTGRGVTRSSLTSACAFLCHEMPKGVGETWGQSLIAKSRVAWCGGTKS